MIVCMGRVRLVFFSVVVIRITWSFSFYDILALSGNLISLFTNSPPTLTSGNDLPLVVGLEMISSLNLLVHR